MTNKDRKVYVVTQEFEWEGSALVDVYTDKEKADKFVKKQNDKLGFRYANGTESFEVTEKTLR